MFYRLIPTIFQIIFCDPLIQILNVFINHFVFFHIASHFIAICDIHGLKKKTYLFNCFNIQFQKNKYVACDVVKLFSYFF